MSSSSSLPADLLNAELSEAVASTLTVGHRPKTQLTPQDAALFRAFQSNLLSLISHELRTPLIGIMNALSVLNEDPLPEGISSPELLRMARTNAHRLHQALGGLLDLAELDSGTFHARLREVELLRLLQARLAVYSSRLAERGVHPRIIAKSSEVPVLGDAQKLGRALDICFDLVLDRGPRDSGNGLRDLHLRISSSEVEFQFELADAEAERWDSEWSHGQAGFQGGLASPASVFGGILRSEQEFLTRKEEGLGSEFTLLHEILRVHRGQVQAERKGTQVRLGLRLLPLDSEETLRAVLLSRTVGVSTGLARVSLVLIQVPGASHSSSEARVEEFLKQIKSHLFRSSDAVYGLPARGQVALVLDDMRAEDLPNVIARLEKAMGMHLVIGAAHSPSEHLDPAILPKLASARLQEAVLNG